MTLRIGMRNGRPGDHFGRRFAVAVLTLGAWLWAATASAQVAPSTRVLVATVDGAITPVTAAHVADGIERATEGGYAGLVLRIDTPGGLESSMRDIVQDILAARVPVIVYVSPDGARAASAGAIITLAGHVAAMAPGTSIGASTPVNLDGGDAEAKIVNDAAALAESIARLRGRNVEFAVDTVREGRSEPADEAVDIGAVDLSAPDLATLLDRVDGRSVTVAPGQRTVTLRVAGAAVDEYDLGLFRRIQQFLADPNVVYLLLSLGTLALILELAGPGFSGAGIAGAVSILLSMFGAAVLPVNVVGLLLVALAAGLFVVEVVVPGFGLAGAGGAVALTLGGVLLFDDVPGGEFEVSAAVLVPVAVVAAGGALLAGRVARAVRATPQQSGLALLVGREIVVGRAEGARGWTFVEGAWWQLRAGDGEALKPGAAVRVVEVDGLDLVVEATASHERKEQP